jgi:hypothetical protein
MAKPRTRKWLLSAVASLTCLLAVGFYALAQAPDEAKRDRKVAVPGGTVHVLPATLETTQWDGAIPRSFAVPTSSGCNAPTASRSSSAGIAPTTSTVSVKGQLPSPGSTSAICAWID